MLAHVGLHADLLFDQAVALLPGINREWAKVQASAVRFLMYARIYPL